jgi:hypothetical protein
MGVEVFEKKASEYLLYFQERLIVMKSGVVDMLIGIFLENKVEDFVLKETQPEKGKYLLEASWGYTENKNFCKALLITANSKKKTITISGEEEVVIKKRDWADKERLREKTIKVYQSPARRSNVPFTEAFKE